MNGQFINFRPERPLEVEYVVERVERGDVNDHPGESDVCDCHRHDDSLTH